MVQAIEFIGNGFGEQRIVVDDEYFCHGGTSLEGQSLRKGV
jgi:hypothetical protein